VLLKIPFENDAGIAVLKMRLEPASFSKSGESFLVYTPQLLQNLRPSEEKKSTFSALSSSSSPPPVLISFASDLQTNAPSIQPILHSMQPQTQQQPEPKHDSPILETSSSSSLEAPVQQVSSAEAVTNLDGNVPVNIGMESALRNRTNGSSLKVRASFMVHYNTYPGQDLVVCGSINELGDWELDNASKMRWQTGGWWRLEILLNKFHIPFYYKYCVVNRSTGEVLWESIKNRHVFQMNSILHLRDTWNVW